MASRQQALRARLLDLLAAAPDGLGLDEAMDRVNADGEMVSPRGVRDTLNAMAEEGLIVRHRRARVGPGAPPFHYYHPTNAPADTSTLDAVLERTLGGARADVATRDELEREDLRFGELERQQNASSVLVRIAQGMVDEDGHAAAVVAHSVQLSALNPVDTVVEMARWVVDDLNELATVAAQHQAAGRMEDAERAASELDTRLGWARRYFHGFWRLDRGVPGAEPILEIPRSAVHFHHHQARAELYESRARDRLATRILGSCIAEAMTVDVEEHTIAAGTDASVADISMDRGSGAFGNPTTVAVMTAAAALVQRSNGATREYQDFDVFPDQLHQIADHTAAARGFVLSPAFRHLLPERDFRHSRMAALELRQYDEELRIVLRDAKWRPVGSAPTLGVEPRPTMIFRDGRTFPLVHRIRDYESPGLYGQIVRNQIEKFSQILHHTFSGPSGEVVYGAVVKSPEMSWLSPLVFWHLHASGAVHRGRRVVADGSSVYRPPFADSAVAHLLFMGLARGLARNVTPPNVFRTCVAIRRFVDIAFDEETLPVMVTEALRRRPLKEDSEADWSAFIKERIREKEEREHEAGLPQNAYRPFVYLCAHAGAAMCYGAPTELYDRSRYGDITDVPQFLLPRLEASLNVREPERAEKDLAAMLGWLASGGSELSRRVSSRDSDGEQTSLPVLVPDVIALAHDAAAFAKRALSTDVEDELRKLVAALRRQFAE